MFISTETTCPDCQATVWTTRSGDIANEAPARNGDYPPHVCMTPEVLAQHFVASIGDMLISPGGRLHRVFAVQGGTSGILVKVARQIEGRYPEAAFWTATRHESWTKV